MATEGLWANVGSIGVADAPGIILRRSLEDIGCYDRAMTLVPLTTYLRTYRKRAGLTNDEVAFLAGSMSGTSVTRHENAKRLPLLRTALIYELILRVPVRTLYEGVVFDALRTVRQRALGLCASLERQTRTKARERKIAHLQALIEDLGGSSAQPQ